MFELVFAWAFFTLALGKGAEAALHAWRGTAPPGHTERMAKIRAKEAKALRDFADGGPSGGGEGAPGPGPQPGGSAGRGAGGTGRRRGGRARPSEGFRGWARMVWSDAWEEAADRHAERWPAKARRKREAARQRWQWWDHVQDQAGDRWEQRRAERRAGREEAEQQDRGEQPGESGRREGEPPQAADQEQQGAQDQQEAERARGRKVAEDLDEDGREDGRWLGDYARRDEQGRIRYMAWQDPQRYGRYVSWEELTENERKLHLLETETDPFARIDDAGMRGRLKGERELVRKQARRPNPPTPTSTPDAPDSGSQKPAQGPGEASDGGRAGARTPGQGPRRPGAGAKTPEMGLAAASRFANQTGQAYQDQQAWLEGAVAWLSEHTDRVDGPDPERSGSLLSAYSSAFERTADIVDKVAEIAVYLDRQLMVRDAVEAAGANALDKDALDRRT